MAKYEILIGDAAETLRTLPSDSVDSIVTDPPYGLSKAPDMKEVMRHWLNGDDYQRRGGGFMGKSWDSFVPGPSVWREAMRVLKPGGHLLAFAGSRTQDLMALSIRLAGFEIRDSIEYLHDSSADVDAFLESLSPAQREAFYRLQDGGDARGGWIFGSGFPKSLDVSKAIDKVNGEPDRLLKFTTWFRGAGMSVKQVTDILRDAGLITENGTMAGHYFAKSIAGQPAIPTAAMWQVLRPHCGEVPDWVDALVARIEAEREVMGEKDGNLLAVAPGQENDRSATTLDITAPATDAARQWEGWGTALKPAHEPIVMARKPLAGTVAANVMEHGTGALNIDGCRVGTERIKGTRGAGGQHGKYSAIGAGEYDHQGRFPANLIHDGSDDVVGLFPASVARPVKPENIGKSGDGAKRALFGNGSIVQSGYYDTETSAARFFYCAKASKKDRDEDNKHPTVKPTELMRYLCRLVTPPGGTVLDPFMGSGSTGKAALLEGFQFIGIEIDPEYAAIAERRLSACKKCSEEVG